MTHWNEPPSRGNARLIKAINEGAVLNLVRDHGPISRSEIAALTGLTPPTVASMLDALAAQGIIQPVGLGASTGGRKPLLYEFNADAEHVIGVDMGGTKTAGALTNLAGRVIASAELTRETGPPDPFDRLTAVIDQLRQQSDRKIRGIGLGVAGVVSLTEGTVTLAPGLGWSAFPLGARLEERYGLPVFLDNDVNAILLGERWFGAAREAQDVLCVAVGTGIGAAMLLGGQIYRGANEAAGEVGHFITDPRAAGRSRQGDVGCLEWEAAGPGIARRGSAALGRPVTAPELMFLAGEGDLAARAVVDETARQLGVALANMACLLNPELIILTGGVMRSGELLRKPICDTVARLVPYPPRILLSELDHRAGVLGAVALVLEASRLLTIAPPTGG